MTSTGPDLNVSLNLPFVSIGTSNVGAWLRRQPRPSPYMFISVTCGLALDATEVTGQGEWPRLRRPNGKPAQLWWLKQAGGSGDIHVVSAFNGMHLDAGRDVGKEPPVIDMWPDSGSASQRWRLSPSPDNRAQYLSSIGSGLVLDCPWDVSHDGHPTMWRKHGGENQHWVVAKPFAATPG